MYEELIKALRLAADKQRFGNYPTITVSVETAYKLADAIESLTAQLAALQSENTEKDRAIERLKAKAKHWQQTSEENFASCDKLQAALSRVEAERDAAIEDIEMDCRNCLHQGERYTVCKSCEHCDAWEWRGAQGEE